MIVDLSPTVPHGFKGSPSTDLGVQLDVRVKPGYWQSAQMARSCHTGCHVESARHVVEGGIDTPAYCHGSPALTADTARRLVELEPRCIGCDFFEEPAARDPGWVPEDFVVHRTILEAGIVLVEGLVNLAALPPRCRFFAPFSKLGGVEAAPARAFAIVGGEEAQ